MIVPLVDTRGKRGIWLLDFNVGGRPFQFAEEKVVLLTEDGDEVTYLEGLGQLDLSVINGPVPSTDVVISSDIDWPLLVAEGNVLDLGQATIRRWFEGQTLERARVQLRGEIESPAYDRVGADLTFTVTERPLRRSDPIIQPHARIDANTWPITATFTIDEKSGDSRPYPWIFGYPGELPDGTVVAAVPVPTAEFKQSNQDTRVALSRGPIEATSVDLFNYTGGVTTNTRTVDEVRDLRNMLVATATVGNMLASPSGGQLYYAGFSQTNGGGVLRRDRSAAIRGAGELTRFIMQRFIRRTQLDPSFDAVQDRLDAWKIDTWLDGEDLKWWEFLTRELWPLMPVVPVRRSEGISLEFIDFAAETRDARFELNADRRAVTRVPGIETLNGQSMVNEITLKYAPKRDSGRFHQVLTVSAEAGFLQDREFGANKDRRVLANVFCRRSQSLYNVRKAVRTTHMTWDRPTAGLILQWWAARDSIPRRRIRYRGGHGLESVPPWKPVVLRDSELHIDGAVAWLEDIEAGPGEDTAVLIVQDHPHIGTRSTT